MVKAAGVIATGVYAEEWDSVVFDVITIDDRGTLYCVLTLKAAWYREPPGREAGGHRRLQGPNGGHLRRSPRRCLAKGADHFAGNRLCRAVLERNMPSGKPVSS